LKVLQPGSSKHFQEINKVILSIAPETTIITCSSGHDLLEIVTKENPQIIIMDLEQHFTDNLETVERLKNEEAVYIVLIANSADSGSLHKADAIADDYIFGSLGQAELKMQIRKIIRDVTARKRAEEEIKRSNSLLIAQMDASLDGILVTDEKREVLCYNKQFIDMWGITPQIMKASGENRLKQLVHLVEKPDIDEFLRRVEDLYQRPNETIRDEFIFKDGRVFERYSGPVVFGENCYGRVWLFRDISARKKIEEELNRSNSLLKAQQEAFLDGILVVGENRNTINYNKQLCNLFDITQDELAKLDYTERLEYIVSKFKEPESKHIEDVLEVYDQSFKKVRDELYLKDGRVLERYSGPIFSQDGQNYFGRIWSFRDISERKRIEDALRESEEYFRLVANNFPNGFIALYDKDFRFIMIEGNGLKDTSLRKELLLGQKLSDVFPQDFSRVMESYCGAAFNGQEITFEISFEGQIFLQTVIPFRNMKDEVIAVMGVAQNITERKRIEEELLKTDKLESIGFLAGGIAHDFNNILAIMLGNISLARTYRDNVDKVYEKLETIEKAINQAKDLTQQLFIFAKGGEPVKKTVQIQELIKNNTTFALSGSNVSCDFSFPHKLLPVKVDRAQISQVINNIIINAIQAMPDGGTIHVQGDNVLEGANKTERLLPLKKANYIKISIKDQGIGIKDDYLKKIFDPFFTTKIEGSGLGLATSYSIIKKHEGYIEVRSKVNEGTTFDIYIPASVEAGLAEVKEDAVSDLYCSGKGKILLMDDGETIGKVADEMLSYLGYNTIFARDGKEAIELYKKAMDAGQPFDVVILDLTIPGGMGGRITVEELREIDPGINAIVSSGYSNDDVIANFREYGFKGMVKKPYKIQDLADVLQQFGRRIQGS
jgi:two-component system, cell cycle sensor histidine kinase and response regulator CckA